MILEWVKALVRKVGQDQLRAALNKLREPGVTEVTMHDSKGREVKLRSLGGQPE